VSGFVTSNDSPPCALQDVDWRCAETRKIDKQPRRRGAPKGNRNRFKTGLYTKEAKALRKQIAAWKRTTSALLRQIENEFPSPPLGARATSGATNNPS
jgi:hypothetical protein